MIDKFTKKAFQQGFKARSVFKLEDLNRKYKLIKKNQRILDLGCWPGSWSQFCKRILGNTGLILGVDTKEIRDIDIIFIKKNVMDKDIIQEISKVSDKFDLVLSDLAPKTTGIQDSEYSMDLAKQAFYVSSKLLKSNGNFIVKVFQGKDLNKFIDKLKSKFRFVKSTKPLASKKTSKEIYIICLGKRW
ncbi:MAG TPA: RlmE family RNA methyltransferase [Candidatus Nanoarchaeia archaeon]|nr:RlmE family RNA methyltransferase [Candidatus Nanoarchaeia archaeon]